MKFSIHSLHGGVKNIDEIHKRAVRAEELGWDGIFLGESHLSSIDSFQTLASCAMLTKNVLLGIAVTNIVFRHPTVIAGAAASLNEISKGRAIMGLGTGDGPVYTQGLKAMSMKDFEVGIKAIRNLVRGNAETFSTGKVGIGFKINQPAPIYVSAEGPKGLQLAGRSADGVILGTGFDLRVYHWAKQKIREGAREAGRQEGEIKVIAAGMLCVDEDGNKARKIVRNRLANRAPSQFSLHLRNRTPRRTRRHQAVHGRLRCHETNGGPSRPRSSERLSDSALLHRGKPKGMHRAHRRTESRRCRTFDAHTGAHRLH